VTSVGYSEDRMMTEEILGVKLFRRFEGKKEDKEMRAVLNNVLIGYVEKKGEPSPGVRNVEARPVFGSPNTGWMKMSCESVDEAVRYLKTVNRVDELFRTILVSTRNEIWRWRHRDFVSILEKAKEALEEE
jgi:hypothetical protein